MKRAGFVLRLARRELRAAWRQFAGLVACVALGVAALVAVSTLGANLDRALAREGKTLVGGDLELRSPRPLPADASAALAPLLASGAAVARAQELVAMARQPAGNGTVLVEVKAVGGGYPLYGRVETSPAGALHALLGDDGVIVEPSLLERLGAAVGDRLVLGDATFTIRATLLREPDRGGVLTLGPRVLLSEEALADTGLVRFGSRVRYRTLLRLPDDASASQVREAVARRIEDPAVRVVSYDEARPGLRRFFEQLTSYLGLVALATLFVGGIGVAVAVATFLHKRRTTIAILKMLGAEWRLLLAAYLLQAVALGLLGSLLGAALGLAIQPVVIGLLRDLLPLAVEARPALGSVLRGVLMGALTTLLVAIWPLLALRAVPPSLLLRRDVETLPDPPSGRWPVAAVLAAGLAGLVLWQAGSVRMAATFAGLVAAALLLLALLARGLVALARRAPRVGTPAWRQGVANLARPAWRQGVANLARPGGHAPGIVVALGLGVMLLVAVALLEVSLHRQLDHERRREIPSFFFVDVQAAQRERLEALVGDIGGARPALTPVVRARLARVGGEAVTRDLVARRAAEGARTFYFTRDYVLTATGTLPPGNRVTRGRWWEPGETGGRILASVEEEAARNLGLALGDRLTFDVQGVPVEAEVASLREVDWQTLSMNFFVILSPGSLEGAPTTYLGTVRVPAERETALQTAIAAELPSVTVVPVREVVERVDVLLGRIALAVRVIAALAAAVGMTVMAGALAASRYQRLTESMILRMLGASRAVVARIFAVEYACLGAAAGLAGSLLACVLAWAVLRFVLHTPWTLAPGVLAGGVLAAVTVAVIVGFLATFRLLGQKPLPVLRGE